MTDRAGSIAIQFLGQQQRDSCVALLRSLRVSLFGVHSDRLYAALIADALKGRVDCRTAAIGERVCGVVIAAPRSYWRSALLCHAGLAFECAVARLSPSGATVDARRSAGTAASRREMPLESARPPLTWANPGDGWRIVIVGTAPEARGMGVAAALYRAVMRDRSLVARIAWDNEASIRLHRSVGWRLYPDGEVVLAVHVRDR